MDLDESETEDDDPDWDDIVMLIGSEIVRKVRAAIREQLKYTCSAGVARNKMIAKLGSAHKKPNQQTIVRSRAIQQFLSGFKFTKIRNLGGKLGDEVVATFGTEQVIDLLKVSLEQMKSKVGDDTGSWVYHVIRGEDSSEVNPRTQIKSMLSAKSFRPTINSIDQAHRWLRIFIADIFSRLVEEGVLENKRRPKTMNLHHRQGQQTRSRQAPIPTGRSIDETLLFDIAKNILAQIVVDGRAWPCSNLSLSVGGFEEGPTGNKGIGGFLVRSHEAKVATQSSVDGGRRASPVEGQEPPKRRRTENGALPSLFARRNTSHGDSSDALYGTESHSEHSEDIELQDKAVEISSSHTTQPAANIEAQNKGTIRQNSNAQRRSRQPSIDSYLCEQCDALVALSEEGEHQDWHFARDLQKQEQLTPRPIPTSGVTRRRGPGRPTTNAPPTKQVEKGQSRLVFDK